MKTLSVEEIVDLAIQAEEKPPKSSTELLEVFDNNGKSLGAAPRLLCHRLGLIHQVVHVLVVTSPPTPRAGEYPQTIT